MAPDGSVLHVLPHPGGGGETYVDLLDDMPGYQFSRAYLAASPEPSARELARGVARAHAEGRKHDLVHVHGDATAILCLGLFLLRPSVVTFNGLHLSRRVTGVAHAGATAALRSVVRAASRTICVCHSELEYLERLIGPKRASRAVVVYNGVRVPRSPNESERAAIRDGLAIDHSAVVGIWVGSLDGRKGPLLAVRAAQQAGLTLLVVGDGPMRERVTNAASDSVRVLGQRDDVNRLLTASDVFILTSDREGFAFSLLEAMAQGLAPVVTTLPENLEAIGGTGIGVPVGDQPALVIALEELARDSGKRQALGEAARSRVIDFFDVSEMVTRTREHYDFVLTAGK